MARSAIDILKEEHKKMQSLFVHYDRSSSSDEREQIVQEIALQLHVHCALEAKLFYPAIQKVLHEVNLTDEANRQHDRIKLVIDKLQRLTASEDGLEYTKTVENLRQSVQKHIADDEAKIMPILERSDVDLIALGDKLNMAKENFPQP